MVPTPSSYFNRPGVAGAVLHTALLLIHSVTAPFPPNLQDIINPQPLELGSWNVGRVFTPHHVSHVTCDVSHFACQISHVTCQVSTVRSHMYFFLNDGASRWRVCYQRGLPSLDFNKVQLGTQWNLVNKMNTCYLYSIQRASLASNRLFTRLERLNSNKHLFVCVYLL